VSFLEHYESKEKRYTLFYCKQCDKAFHPEYFYGFHNDHLLSDEKKIIFDKAEKEMVKQDSHSKVHLGCKSSNKSDELVNPF
jgi:hypothetical protein